MFFLEEEWRRGGLEVRGGFFCGDDEGVLGFEQSFRTDTRNSEVDGDRYLSDGVSR